MVNFLIVHIFVSFAYLAFLYKRNREESIYRFCMVLFLPVFGFALFFIIWLIDSFSSKEHLPLDERQELFMYKAKYINRINYTKEANIVPIEEALVLNKSSVKRKLIIDTLKDDTLQYIDILIKALRDDDTETSHYAATAITEIKRKLMLAIQDLAVRYAQDKTNTEIMLAYIDVLNKYLKSGLLDTKSNMKYKYLYTNVLQNLLEVYDKEEEYFISKIECDIELGEYSRARDYCDRFMKIYPFNENPYLMYMKLFYVLRSQREFEKMLYSLKNSQIKLSSNALNIIRFWTERVH